MTQLLLHLNFMGHFICKYLMVIGVVLLGFQCSAFTDEKDTYDKKDSTTVTKTDTTKIKVNLDIHADDTLVFDDFDEDKDEKGDNSAIALMLPTKVRICIIPRQQNLVIACGMIVRDPSTQIDTSVVEPTNILHTQPIHTTIYPNPASASDQSIYVSHNLNTTATITVYSLSGQIISTTQSIEQRVELPGLATGLYIVNIAGENQSDSQRLLVK